jgi:hypothetical protein
MTKERPAVLSCSADPTRNDRKRNEKRHQYSPQYSPVPRESGTLIYNGPTHEIDLAGGTSNPFAGTTVSFLGGSGTSFSVGGYLRTGTGQFDFNLQGGFPLWGYHISSADLDVNNWGVNASGSINFLGVQTAVDGWIGFDGQAELWDSASVTEYLNLTWDGCEFVVDFGVKVNFVMDY